MSTVEVVWMNGEKWEYDLVISKSSEINQSQWGEVNESCNQMV